MRLKTILIIATCATFVAGFAVYSMGSSHLSREKAAEIIQKEIEKAGGRTVASLELRGADIAALLPTTASRSAGNVQGIISEIERAIRISDAEFDAFSKSLGTQDSPSQNSRNGAIVRPYEISVYRALWKTGAIEKFTWVTGSSLIATAVPKQSVRQHCISYKEGDAVCNYLAAAVTLKSIDGIADIEDAKHVEFTLHHEPNADGKKLASLWKNLQKEPVWVLKSSDMAMVATLVRYDDGWRLTPQSALRIELMAK